MAFMLLCCLSQWWVSPSMMRFINDESRGLMLQGFAQLYTITLLAVCVVRLLLIFPMSLLIFLQSAWKVNRETPAVRLARRGGEHTTRQYPIPRTLSFLYPSLGYPLRSRRFTLTGLSPTNLPRWTDASRYLRVDESLHNGRSSSCRVSLI